MSRRRRLRRAAPGRPRPARRTRPAGLVPGRPRQRQRPGQEGGALAGPNPTDRGKAGSNYHLLVDAAGLPLDVLVSGANRHDSMLVEQILDSMPAIKRGGRGAGRSSCTGTRATTMRGSAATCAAAGSPPASPASAGTPAPASDGIAGSSNAPSADCRPTNDWPCATTAPPRRSPPWSGSRSPSSAPDACRRTRATSSQGHLTQGNPHGGRWHRRVGRLHSQGRNGGLGHLVNDCHADSGGPTIGVRSRSATGVQTCEPLAVRLHRSGLQARRWGRPTCLTSHRPPDRSGPSGTR